jgi:DNA sulfur modification protein DndC
VHVSGHQVFTVNALVKQRVGHWGEANLHLGARRAESSTRAQTMAARQTRNGLRRHPDLPRVWVSNPIEFLSTEEVWAYLLQNSNPRGNRPLYKLYASASNGECPIQIDTSTPVEETAGSAAEQCVGLDHDGAAEGAGILTPIVFCRPSVSTGQSSLYPKM